MQTGDLIKKARINAGMTQAELAERLGITPQAVSQYERGIKNPKLETVRRISEALGVLVPDLYPEGMQAMPILDWMESKGIPIVSGPGESYWESLKQTKAEQNSKEEQLLNHFRTLNENGQTVAVERVQELAQIPAYQRPADPAGDVPGGTDDKDPAEK